MKAKNIHTKNIRTKWVTGLLCVFSMLLTIFYMNNCAKSDRYNSRGYYGGGHRGGNIACTGGYCQPGGIYGGGNIIYGGGMGGSVDTNILATALGEIAGYGSVGLTLINGMGGYHHNNVYAGNVGAYPTGYDNSYGNAGYLPTGGGVSAQGTFYADQRMAQHTCAIGGYNGRIVVPPGVYQIAMTLQPGSWDQSSVRNLRVQAHGPVALDLYFPSLGLYGANPAVTLPHTGEIFSNHMWGQVVIERVNGVPCQSLSFEME